MTDSARDALRDFLVLDYAELKRRLTHRLGSAEFAGDVLHETYLKVSQPTVSIEAVRSPRLFLLRVAINIAFTRKRRDSRFVTLSDAKIAIGIRDEAPDPEQATAARFEIAALQDALLKLSVRQREILLASRLDNIPLHKIAEHYGLSQRMVEIELRRAVAACALRLGRTVTKRFGPQPSNVSE